MAPDGIAVHTFDVPAAKLVGVAEGRIPTGRFAIHRHLTLEQYSYVISGRLTAVTSSQPHHHEITVDLASGDLLLTLPGETLQFVNQGPEVARVLFICAPPYPVDDSDTRVLEEHTPAGIEEAQAAMDRLLNLRAGLNAEVDARMAELRRVVEERKEERRL